MEFQYSNLKHSICSRRHMLFNKFLSVINNQFKTTTKLRLFSKHQFWLNSQFILQVNQSLKAILEFHKDNKGNTQSKDIGRVVNTKAINGKACDMVLVYFTIRMEGCMKVSGDLTKCKARVNCITSQESQPMKEIGLMISSKAMEYYITNILRLQISL